MHHDAYGWVDEAASDRESDFGRAGGRPGGVGRRMWVGRQSLSAPGHKYVTQTHPLCGSVPFGVVDGTVVAGLAVVVMFLAAGVAVVAAAVVAAVVVVLAEVGDIVVVVVLLPRSAGTSSKAVVEAVTFATSLETPEAKQRRPSTMACSSMLPSARLLVGAMAIPTRGWGGWQGGQ